jgi:hypothetical protein
MNNIVSYQMASSWVWVTTGLILIIFGIILFSIAIYQRYYSALNFTNTWSASMITLLILGIILFFLGIILALVPMFRTPKDVKMAETKVVIPESGVSNDK